MPVSFHRGAANSSAAPPVMRRIVVAGQPLHVTVRPGAGAGVPLLLVNGIGASLELLQPFVDELDPALDVIRFDVPGVGGSPLPARPYRFSGLCRLMARLLSALGYSRADVLGISWGGAVAQHFALVQSGRCRRLVLVSTATGGLMVPARPSVLARVVTSPQYWDPAQLLDAPDFYGGSADRVGALTHIGSRVGSTRGYFYQLAAVACWTSLPFLPLIRQPTLIVSGDDDPLIPLANARLMHSLIPHSRLHVFHGGHLGLVTEAHQAAPAISQFLAARAPVHGAFPRGDTSHAAGSGQAG